MDITIRHLSGSRAGQEQAFGHNRITIGRSPTNDVAFDPQADSIVSGHHAELTPRQDGWLLRDLGSSNGTFVNDERITEQLLRPQEIVQLGKNGPRLQFTFELPAGVQAPEAPRSNAPVEGRTVMMMMNEGIPPMSPAPAGFSASAPSAPAYVPQAPAKKKGGVLKALLLVILVLGFLMVAGLAAVIYVKSGSRPKATATKAAAKSPTSTAASSNAPAAATSGTSTAAELTPETMASSTSASQTGAAQTGEGMSSTPAETGTSLVSPGASRTPLTLAELEQQLARSQELINGLQKQLQETNDRLQKTIQEKDAAIQRAVRERNAALRRAREAEARAAESQSSRRFLERPKPVQVAGVLPFSVLAALSMQADDLDAGLDGLTKDKIIKKRLTFAPEQAEIPLPGMPAGLPASLGRLVIQSLASTGKYVSVRKSGDAAISVVVTNYKSEVKKTADTTAVARGVGSVSRIFGGPNVPTPAAVKTVSMDADMTARFKLLDPVNFELGQVFTEAASRDRQTSLDVGTIDINQIENTDTALGDVTRKVAADAVEYLLAELENIEWQGQVTRSDNKTGMITVDCGSRCQIEVGDVFSIRDGDELVGTATVKKITVDSAVAEITSGEGNMKGKTVRFEGRMDESPATRKSREVRTLKTREAGTAHAGPGNSFAEVRKLKAGSSLNLLYTVGSWARVSDGTASFWISLENAQITS